MDVVAVVVALADPQFGVFKRAPVEEAAGLDVVLAAGQFGVAIGIDRLDRKSVV